MAEVGAAEALGDNQRFRVRVAAVIEPGLVVESGGSDNKDVAFPFTGRIPQPRGWSVGFKRASVQVDLPEHRLDLVQDYDHGRCLDDAVWTAAGSPVARDAVRQTVILGIVSAESFDALVEEGLSPRSHRDVFRLKVGGEVPVVFDVRAPKAGEVRFPVRRAWRGTTQIRLEIRCARHAGIAGPRPLSGSV